MKKMNAKELKDIEMEKLLQEKRGSLRVFKFGIAGSKSKNVKEGKFLRRDIARMLTEINHRKASVKSAK